MSAKPITAFQKPILLDENEVGREVVQARVVMNGHNV
jgi:hypothetical protein